MATYRVTIKPEKSAAQSLTIAQPSLRVSISAGLAVAQKTPAQRAAAGEVVWVQGALDASGAYDAATLAAIAAKQAEGWPDYAIAVRVDSDTSIAARAAAGEVVQVLGYTTAGGGYDADTLAKIAAKQALGWPDYAIWVRVMGEAGAASCTVSFPSFSAVSTLTAPTVTAVEAGVPVSATASIPSFTSLATLTAPTVTAQLAAVANVPQFAASATLTAPTVSAQLAANVSVPSFTAVSTLTAPTVTIVPAGAQGATVTVGSFTAQAALTVPTVTAQLAAKASVPYFGATATLTAPSVTAQRAATASVPSFTATSTLTAPTVTAVEQAAAVSATASVPSFMATATLAVPTVTAVQNAGGTTETFSKPFTSWPYTGDVGTWDKWAESGYGSTVSGGSLVMTLGYDSEYDESISEQITATKNIPAGTVSIKCRLSASGSMTVKLYNNGTYRTGLTLSSTTQVTLTYSHSGFTKFGISAVMSGNMSGSQLIVDEISWT